jgi:betaine-homocysteine S-methyltransferase
VEEMNRTAVRIAREVASEGEVLVAGNLSETWGYDPHDSASGRHVREMLDRQLAIMTEEGVDFIIAETFLWLGEAMIAAEAIEGTGLPAMVTMTFDNYPTSYEGLSPGECARRLADAGVDIVGVNCLRSPEHTLPIMQEVRDAVPDTYLATQPVAYHGNQPNFTSLPEFPYELETLQLPRKEMAVFAKRARDMGYDYIGSCCGSVASHVKAMAQALGKLPAEERAWRSMSGKPMSGYELHQPENR